MYGGINPYCISSTYSLAGVPLWVGVGMDEGLGEEVTDIYKSTYMYLVMDL